METRQKAEACKVKRRRGTKAPRINMHTELNEEIRRSDRQSWATRDVSFANSSHGRLRAVQALWERRAILHQKFGYIGMGTTRLILNGEDITIELMTKYRFQ